MTRHALAGCKGWVLALLGLLPMPALAQTFTVPVVADTHLRDGAANRNSGGETMLQLSGNQRVLLRAEQAAIASAVGSGRLVSASLELYVRSASGWGADGRLVEAHRLTAAWTEAGATWSCGVDSQPTNSKPDCATQWDGGTFEEDSSDTVLHTNDEHRWVQFDVTADVAAFLAGTANQGWLLKREDDAGAGRVDYASREGAATERPRLVLLVETAANDQVPPSLAITSPSRSILVNEPSPAVTVEYADGGSGVDTATLQVLLDGQDVAAACAAGASSAGCHPAALAAGNHTLQARLRDRSGNLSQASLSFQLLLGQGPHLVAFQAVGDTYLRKGEANRNFGAEPILRVREGGKNRSLVQLDPQSLTTTLAGATLVSASLELHVEKNGRNWGKQGRTVDAHRVTAAWTETGATWSCPADSNLSNSKPDCAAPWDGGSFAATPTASVLHTRDLAGWVSFNVTADVATFLSGTPNRGWLIKKTDEKKSGRVDYDSRQGTAGEAPRLVVVFTTQASGDTIAPELAVLAPVPDSLMATSAPKVIATYLDAGSGIDPASVRVQLDGVDRTAEAQVDEAGISLAPGSPLSDGVHQARVIVRDRAGNKAQRTVGFTIDTTAPALAIVEPAARSPRRDLAGRAGQLLGRHRGNRSGDPADRSRRDGPHPELHRGERHGHVPNLVAGDRRPHGDGAGVRQSAKPLLGRLRVHDRGGRGDSVACHHLAGEPAARRECPAAGPRGVLRRRARRRSLLSSYQDRRHRAGRLSDRSVVGNLPDSSAGARCAHPDGPSDGSARQ